MQLYHFYRRAEIIVGGFVVECVTEDPPLCKVTYVTRADLKGMLFVTLTQMILFGRREGKHGI